MANLTVFVYEWSNFAALEPSCSNVIPTSAEIISVEDFGDTSGGGRARKKKIGLSLCSLTKALINGVCVLHQL